MEAITKEELKGILDRGEPIVLVDVRDTPDYERGHIPGAVHLLIADMTESLVKGMFGIDDAIVVYSQDQACPAKFIAAERLIGFGFKNVRAYPGSWMEWKQAGYPVET